MANELKKVPEQIARQPKKRKPTGVTLFPSDKNGCGFYRTFIPFNYLMGHYEFDTPSLFSFMFDLNFIVKSDWLRFQRQVTHAQKMVIKEYKKVIAQTRSGTKIAYDLDDLVHGIEPSNVVAWQFYTPTRKKNLIDIFKMVDTVTFSTQYLKDYYEEEHGIINSTVVPNYLPKFLWGSCGKRNKKHAGKKPRILWAGSSSHVNKGGDMEFLVPLIRKTKKEFQWVFVGCYPPELEGEIEFHPWSGFWEYPAAIDTIDADMAICPIKDVQFNYAKSDLKLLEYSALGIPAIYSSIGNGIGPYDLVDGTVTVENKVDDWYNAIKKMAYDEDVQEESLKNGRIELEKRWLENNVQTYLDVYKRKDGSND